MVPALGPFLMPEIDLLLSLKALVGLTGPLRLVRAAVFLSPLSGGFAVEEQWLCVLQMGLFTSDLLHDWVWTELGLFCPGFWLCGLMGCLCILFSP